MKKAEARATPEWVLGAMSGTSLDGVDAAMLLTDGDRILEFGETGYRAYTDEERAVLRAALGKWTGPEVEAAAEVVLQAHEELLDRFSPDLIGFHGQTVAHAPRKQGTNQVGDGVALARDLCIPVAWDFRSSDVEFGGQGAPLAPFYHFALAKYMDARKPLVFLNLGGVGNLTYVDPSKDGPEARGALLAFDTGPANAPINDLMSERLGLPHDEGGKTGAQGSIEQGVLEAFLAKPYFAQMPPKSLDRNDFAEMVALVSDLSTEDAAATLTGMCAASVAAGMEHCPTRPARVLVCGGGRHNTLLMNMLEFSLDCPVVPIEDVGFDGDMIEAQAFAFLAKRVARGLTTSSPSTTGVRMAVGGGTVSRP